ASCLTSHEPWAGLASLFVSGWPACSHAGGFFAVQGLAAGTGAGISGSSWFDHYRPLGTALLSGLPVYSGGCLRRIFLSSAGVPSDEYLAAIFQAPVAQCHGLGRFCTHGANLP